MIISYNDFLKTAPRQMWGVILLSDTDLPIEKALISTTNGETETRTDSCGCFLLKTWSDLPLDIIIEHLDYKTARFRWEKGTGPIQIRLIKK